MKYFVTIDKDREYEIEIENEGKGTRVKMGEKQFVIDISYLGDGKSLVAMVDQKPYLLIAKLMNHKLQGLFLNRPFEFLVEDVEENLLRKIAKREESDQPRAIVECPINGIVTRIAVEKGVRVVKDEPVIIIEAMKMENVFASPMDGELTEICVKSGEVVKPDQVLFVVEKKEEGRNENLKDK
jgi:biotin carboxyl carrier protein